MDTRESWMTLELRRCTVSRDEYLRKVVTASFVRRVIQEVVNRVIGTDDFLSLEEFRDFLILQFLAPPETEIETEFVIRAPDDILLDEEGGYMRSFIPLEIDVKIERGQFSTCIPLRGFVELEGSSQRGEWTSANVRIQIPTSKTFDFAVVDRMLQLEVKVLAQEEEPMKKKKN